MDFDSNSGTSSDINEESSQSDIPTLDQFSQELQACLDDCSVEGSFSSTHAYGLYPNPGISVKNLGIIGLPLSVREAKAIAGECKQAPFGKGDQTLVDESVRKTWELDADEFTCSNPKWTAYLDQLAEQSLKDLGVSVSAHAQPYKLLLYEKGAFFKAHRDTEKVPGMFGTLVVCLPSVHDGGSVHLVHGKKERIIETASQSTFKMTTLAWYSDVQHEIRPITSGHRLVLTYNLVQDLTQPKASAAALDDSHTKLQRLLQTWDGSFSYCSLFVYPLEHLYTSSSLSLNNLKGQDSAKARYLDGLCMENGSYWFLARMTKQERDDEDGFYREELGRSNINDLVTPWGKPIQLQLKYVEKDEILVNTDEWYRDRAPDSEDEEEFTGNESMPAAYRYHDTVMIMIRKNHVIKQFSQYPHHPPSSLYALFQLIRSDTWCPEDLQSAALDTIMKQCLGIISPDKDSLNYRYLYLYGGGRNMDTKRTDSIKVFEKTAEFCYDNSLGHLVRKSLGETIGKVDWTGSKELTDLIAKHMAREAANGGENVWSTWLSTPARPWTTFKFLVEQSDKLHTFKTILPATSFPSFDKWKTAYLDTLLHSINAYMEEDAMSLLKLIPTFTPNTYFEIVLPIVINKGIPSSISGLLHCLGKAVSIGDVPNFVTETYQKLIPVFAPASRLALNETNRTQVPYMYNHTQPTSLNTLELEFIDNIGHCMLLDLKDEAYTLLVAGLPELPEITSKYWSNWDHLHALIKALITVLERHNYARLNNRASRYITKAVKAAASHIKRCRPQFVNWTQPNICVPCNCAPCLEVEEFLRSPTEQVVRFTLPIATRKHIERSFREPRDFNFDTDKSTSPQTLVVSKTQRRYNNMLYKWKLRVAELRKQLDEISSFVISSLQKEVIHHAADLDDAQGSSSAAQDVTMSIRRAPGPQFGVVSSIISPTMVAGTKRKAEVIDLTDDDPPA